MWEGPSDWHLAKQAVVKVTHVKTRHNKGGGVRRRGEKETWRADKPKVSICVN